MSFNSKVIEGDLELDKTITETATVYLLDGNLHRILGPAVSYTDGRKIWWYHGKMHRMDGPAIDYPDEQTWYYHGTKIQCSSQAEFERLLKLKAFW